jgi:hypothetical protein
MTIGFILLTVTIQPNNPPRIRTPQVPLLIVGLAGMLTAGAWLLRSWRWAIGALAIGLSLTGMVGGLRTAYQLNFRWGDVPRELMIYTQTSPDVERVVDRLAEAAIRRGGANDMVVWYDNETVWSWYMRRFTSGVQQPPQLSAPPGDEVQAVLLMQENYDNPQTRQWLEGFRVQRYPLRWWFPEAETYRLPSNWAEAPVTENSPLLMQVLRQPFDEATAARFWRFLLYRQPPAPLGSSDFVIAVRPALADEIGPGLGAEK